MLGLLESLAHGYDPREVLSDAAQDKIDEATKGICSACGAAEAEECDSCQYVPSLADESKPIVGAWYCSDACKEHHAPQQKALCLKLQQRGTLWHTAKFLSDLWQKYRLWAWPHDVKAVERAGKYIVMLMKDDPDPTRTRQLCPFPKDLQKDMGVVYTIAAYNTCEWALAMLRPLLDELISGTVASRFIDDRAFP